MMRAIRTRPIELGRRSRYRRGAVRRIILLVVLAACGSSGNEASVQRDKPTDKPPKLAGVYPAEFKCESIATLAAVGSVLGGTAEALPSASSVPKGVAPPCGYQITTPTAQVYWTFDFDCRANYKKTADALFEQYAQTSADLVTAWNAASDAGIKPTDAGIEIRAPEPSAPVDVGAKGLDHHGRGLIFIDDDAPCYVRVVGTDTARRLELARLVAKNLTFANAPMTPRSFP